MLSFGGQLGRGGTGERGKRDTDDAALPAAAIPMALLRRVAAALKFAHVSIAQKHRRLYFGTANAAAAECLMLNAAHRGLRTRRNCSYLHRAAAIGGG